jgi:hypothetical protein
MYIPPGAAHCRNGLNRLLDGRSLSILPEATAIGMSCAGCTRSCAGGV